MSRRLDSIRTPLYLAPAMSLRPRALPVGFIAPCLPTSAAQPPSGDLWLHEIKHDGFRVIARMNGGRVKLYSRPGNDLTYRSAFTKRQRLLSPEQDEIVEARTSRGVSRRPSLAMALARHAAGIDLDQARVRARWRRWIPELSSSPPTCLTPTSSRSIFSRPSPSTSGRPSARGRKRRSLL